MTKKNTSFMGSDEFLIMMNPSSCWTTVAPYFPTEENKADLRDVGIQTSREFIDWDEIEPVRGHYDFSTLDAILRTNRAVGMKTLIHLPGQRVPLWMPDEWMMKDLEGETAMREDREGFRLLSFWNEEAQEYCDKYLRILIKHYHAPDVLFDYGEFQFGEGMFPSRPFYYEDSAINDYKDKHGFLSIPDILTQETMDWLQEAAIKRVIRVYEIINRHGEIRNCLQLLMDDWTKLHVNYAQKDIMCACKKAFPNSNLVLEQYTYWDSSHTERHRNYVDEIKEEFQCDVIVEAMWPQGLATTTPATIAKGYRGQIVGVSHVHMPDNSSLTSEMLNNIKESHELWLKSSQ